MVICSSVKLKIGEIIESDSITKDHKGNFFPPGTKCQVIAESTLDEYLKEDIPPARRFDLGFPYYYKLSID